MSTKYICQFCLRAARNTRLSLLQPAKARHASKLHGEASTIQRTGKQRAAQSSSVEGIKQLNQEIEKQHYLPNESTIQPPSDPDLPLTDRLARQLRENFSSTTETYVAYGATERLYALCSSQADYSVPQAADTSIEIPKTAYGEDVGVGSSWWYTQLGLTPTFNTWAQITFLHMWLLQARFRLFPRDHVGAWNQHLTDHFFHDAERRMDTMHRITASSIRNQYLKDLFVQYRGITTAYDEGLVRGDAVLAGAIWRNMYKAAGVQSQNKGEVSRDVGEVDWVGVAQIVSYVRRNVARLDGMSDSDVTGGHLAFGTPEEDKQGVLMGHAGLQEPLVDTP